MRYIHLVRNTQVPFLYKFQFNQQSKTNTVLIGNCHTTINRDKAVINLLEIDYPHRKQGHGTFFLKETEEYLDKHFQVKQVDLLAWNSTSGPHVLDFFMKNGYKHALAPISASQTYDDGSTLYDLHSLFKKL